MPDLPLRIHEYLEIARDDQGRKVIRCLRCGNVFCEATDNYKKYALRRVRDLSDVRLRTLITGEPSIVQYQEYICPGCATMLEVDVWCPELDDDEPLWDIQIKV